MIHYIQAGFLLIIIAIVLIFIAPVSQDPAYHLFADRRSCLGLSNCGNVYSNLGFIFVGLAALLRLRTAAANQLIQLQRYTALTLCLIALGSTFYHLNPGNATLFWDRLAMSLCFAALLSIYISLIISIKSSFKLLIWLTIIFTFSVIYWYFSELSGQGDLRLYALVQYGGIGLMLAFLYKLSPQNRRAFGYLTGFYLLAKLTEIYDYQIYQHLQLISGHSLKHIISALALWPVLTNLAARQ